MRSVGLKYLQEEVRKVFDEIGVNTAEFIDQDIDDDNLNTAITSKVVEAVRYVHLAAAPALLTDANVLSSPAVTIAPLPDLHASVTLPNNFLRVTRLKFSDWLYPIYNQMDESSPEYHKQTDPYARGTWENPIAFLTGTAADRRLEVYSCRTRAATVETLQWLPYPRIETNYSERRISICERAKTAIVYRLAGLTMTNYDNGEKVKMCFELCELNLK